ncbi:MAG TPA: hypothetical protein VF998_11255 [Candidatus Limnocylindria bacterium]
MMKQIRSAGLAILVGLALLLSTTSIALADSDHGVPEFVGPLVAEKTGVFGTASEPIDPGFPP